MLGMDLRWSVRPWLKDIQIQRDELVEGEKSRSLVELVVTGDLQAVSRVLEQWLEST